MSRLEINFLSSTTLVEEESPNAPYQDENKQKTYSLHVIPHEKSTPQDLPLPKHPYPKE